MKIRQTGRRLRNGRLNGDAAYSELKWHRLDSNALILTYDRTLLGIISSPSQELNSGMLTLIIDELYCLMGRDDMERDVSEITECDVQEFMRQEKEWAEKLATEDVPDITKRPSEQSCSSHK